VVNNQIIRPLCKYNFPNFDMSLCPQLKLGGDRVEDTLAMMQTFDLAIKDGVLASGEQFIREMMGWKPAGPDELLMIAQEKQAAQDAQMRLADAKATNNAPANMSAYETEAALRLLRRATLASLQNPTPRLVRANMRDVDIAKFKASGIYYVRHGETPGDGADGNPPRRSGWTDDPLTPAGQVQAAGVAEQLRGKGITRIITSGMTRTMQTAQPLSDQIGVPIEVMPDLRTWNIGDFAGQLDSVVSDQVDDYRQKTPAKKPPGGESWNTFTTRYLRAQNKILAAKAKKPDEVWVVIGHREGLKMTAASEACGFNGLDYDLDTYLDTKVGNCEIDFIKPGSGDWVVKTVDKGD
jgi:broad specificity phosphatase PhoE